MSKAASPDDRFLADHFDDHAQQRRAGAMGTWLLLGHELLFFAGLFCVYAVYRGTRPELFTQGARFLSFELGGAASGALLFGSLAAAFSVRFAQLGQSKLLLPAIGATVACGAAAIGLAGLQMSQLVADGLVWGSGLSPSAETIQAALGSAEPAAGLSLFFGLYFVMMGAHVLVLVLGVLASLWLIRRVIAGHFDATYHGPVDFVALHWQVVTIVWLFEYPLLYLVR